MPDQNITTAEIAAFPSSDVVLLVLLSRNATKVSEQRTVLI